MPTPTPESPTPTMPTPTTPAQTTPTPETPTPEALTPTEGVVAARVAELLGCPTPAATDNFFALGGNSLQAIRLVAGLARDLGATMTARQLFLVPTIGEIAAQVDTTSTTAAPLVRRPERGSFPLLPGQQAMLRFLQRVSGPFFEMWEAYDLVGTLDVEALRRALAMVVRENEPLRMVVEPDTPAQRVLPYTEPTLQQVDLSGLAEAEHAEALAAQLTAARRTFDLTAEPAFRSVLVRLGSDHHVLSLTFHHLYFDGWSYGPLYERLAELYAAYTTGAPIAELASRPELGDYALWFAKTATEAVRQADIEHWRAALAGHRPPELCQQIVAAECGSTMVTSTLDEPTTAAVQALAAACAVTPFALLEAVFALVVSHLLDHPDLLISSNDANRYQAGTEQMIGYLSASLLTRIELREDDSFRQTVGRVHADQAIARQHMSVQWESLVAELGLAHAVQLKFSLQDIPAGGLHLTGLHATLRPDEIELRGRRAAVVTVWQRQHGYEVQWYARDDSPLPGPAEALACYARALAAALADPDRTTKQLRQLLSGASNPEGRPD